jgi:hypothetical protein
LIKLTTAGLMFDEPFWRMMTAMCFSVQDILNFSSRELELTYDVLDEKKVTEICYVDSRPKEFR